MENALVNTLTEEEQALLRNRLWELLKLQAARVNGCDSTSIQAERLEELLGSLLYTISVMLETGCSGGELLEMAPSELLRKGRGILEEKKKAALAEYEALCRELPAVRNCFFEDTIKNIRLFFRNYDVYYDAKEIPCSIDYPLLLPVSEEMQGISFMEEYLRCLRMETAFIGRFDPSELRRLYLAAGRDYREQYFNLCEQVLLNAAGLLLAGERSGGLWITDGDLKKIAAGLFGHTKPEIAEMLQNAAKQVVLAAGPGGEAEAAYFAKAAGEAVWRLWETENMEALGRVFVTPVS